MIDPDRIRANQARMEKARSAWDGKWRDIAALVYPALADSFSGAMKRSQFMQQQPPATAADDPYSALALRDGVAITENYVMPRGQRWQAFELGDADLMKKVAVQQWCDDVALGLFKLRNDPQSGFVKSSHKSVLSLLSFGPQSMWVDRRRDPWGRPAGLSYQSEFIGDIWVERDAQGNVMRMHRRINWTAEQAMREWGDKSPECVKKAVRESRPETEFQFLHVIEPNRRLDPERIDMMGKPWHGGYFCESEPDMGLFVEGGYNTLPRIFSAFNSEGESGYGNSPTMLVLPYVKQQQQIFADRMFGEELRLLPPLLAATDELDNAAINITALGLTEGGLDDRGQPMLKELLTEADGSGAMQLSSELRGFIDKVYFRDQLQLNRDYKTHITATRIEEEKAEKGLLLGPLAEQEQEWLSPMTQRELSLMDEDGLIPEMPGEVAEYLESSGVLGIKYDNGLSALQEASKSAAFLSLSSQVIPLGQIDPTYIEAYKRIYPAAKVVTELGRIARVPAAMRASDEELAVYDQKKAEQEQAAQLLEAAPILASAAKDASQAAQPMGL